MDILTALYILAGYLALLAVAGILADFVAPKIGPLMRYIETLPLAHERAEVANFTVDPQADDLAA